MRRATAAMVMALCAAGGCAFESDLPIVRIQTHGEPVPDEPKISADMVINYDPSASTQTFSSSVNYQGKIGIEMRGQSSQGFWKKSYAVELRDEQGADLDASLIEMPSEEDWVLYGPFNDKTLMRNHLTYMLARAMGRYAPRTRFTELFLIETGSASWEDNYMGVYLLTERIKRDANRVNIAKLNPTDVTEPAVTGGYILKIDKTDEGDLFFLTSSDLENTLKDVKIIYVYPEPAELVPQQRAWVETYFLEFEAALLSADFTDPVIGYTKFIDVNSFVDFLIIQELFKNIDGYRISAFMYKDRGGKLAMGPVWDFDLSTGNANYYDGCDTDGWILETSLSPTERYRRPFWWQRLLQDPAFVNRIRSRWQVLRSPGLPWFPPGEFVTSKILARIDGAAAILAAAQERNFAQWHTLGRYLWPNCPITGTSPAAYPKAFAGEIAALKSWMSGRLSWMDANIPTIGP